MPADGLKTLEVTREAREFMFAFPRRHPGVSAMRVVNGLQVGVLLGAFGVVVAGLAFRLGATLLVLNGTLLAFYLVTVAFKAYLMDLSVGAAREMAFTRDEIAGLPDAALPVYTILVPLYHERESVEGLLDALRALDYPKDRLEVIWLLEEDDAETRHAVSLLSLPRYVRVAVVPDVGPRTKPKACNLGLALAHGEFLVIYDAEDRPEPDQLKKAVLGFQRNEPDVICLQAKLDFYNARQNLLTRWFATDYAVWFDLFLPGLDHLGGPVPLGGTSNHFRTCELRALLGWDPYNVTEDCELGVRLALAGKRTRIIDSTTHEEACSALGYWVRQRSRWTKGYLQTYLAHQRRPFALVHALGLRRALSFQVMIGGTFVCLLINPLYWTLTALWFVFRWKAFAELFPFPLILWGLLCLFLGNFAFVYAAMLASCKRGFHDLVKYCLLVPVYWCITSVGAWRGLVQLLLRPSHWDKTRHGLAGR
ncbi:MAG: glycosyltransferase [Candidatus Brocadiaceae bacterium]|nr:glycosyltransferase [Candidatus Brocadiaceae bacterium]